MNAKTIYIFLGSSIVEFKNERDELSNFIHEISGAYFEEQYNVRIRPITCNYSDQSMSIGGKQKEINEGLKECDYCFFIFGSKAGEKTVEEIKIAYEAFKEFQVKPKIYVFFREQDESTIDESINATKELLDKEYQHYYQTFKNTDTIKLQIILALNANKTTTDFNIAIQEGDLLLDNKKVIGLDISKTSTFAFDKDLSSIKEEIKQTDTEYYRLRELMKESDNEQYDEEYADILTKRRSLRKKENDISKQLLDIALKMSGDIANGEMSPRLKEAYRLLEKGNKEECLKILNPEESQADFLKNERLLKAQAMILKNELRKNADTRVKEATLYASVAISTVINDDGLHQIAEQLLNVLPIVDEYDVGFNVYLDLFSIYLGLAEYQNAIDILNRGIKVLQDKGLNENKDYFNLLKSKVLAYIATADYNQTIDTLNDILDKYDAIRDNKETKDVNFEIEYAQILITICSVASILKEGETAVDYGLYAIEVLEDLDENLVISQMIKAYSNLAFAYYNNQELDELKETIDKAKAILNQAKELDIEESTYFDSYIRLLMVEGHYLICSNEFEKGMAIYAKFEKELNDKKDLLKENDYFTTLYLHLRDIASVLTLKGYYVAALKAYKKLVNMPLSKNNRQGLSIDLTNVTTCLGALDIVVNTFINDGDIIEENPEVKEDIKEFVKGALKAVDIAEKNIEANPFVISVQLAKAFPLLISLMEIMDYSLDELFNYAKKAEYYANQCALYPEVATRFKALACSTIICQYYVFGLEKEKEDTASLHEEIIREYAFKLFDLASDDEELFFSLFEEEQLKYILSLLMHNNKPLFDEIIHQYGDLIDSLFPDEDEEDEEN